MAKYTDPGCVSDQRTADASVVNLLGKIDDVKLLVDDWNGSIEKCLMAS